MSSEQTVQTSMYCRRCGYQLVGLSENRCPECGREFDPSNRRTYLRRPKGWARRRWIKGITTLLAVLMLLTVAEAGWLYWGWRYEQPAIALARQAKVTVQVRQVGPAWLIRWTPGKLGWLYERASDVIATYQPVGDAEMAALARLRHVQILSVSGTRVTDAGMVHIRDMTDLRRLGIARTKIGDHGLACAANCKQLEWLGAEESAITSAGLAYLADKQRMHTILVSRTRVGDEGIAYIQNLWRMQDLFIDDTQVTDAGLAYLKAMKRLNNLLIGSLISDGATQRLKQAVPQVTIRRQNWLSGRTSF